MSLSPISAWPKRNQALDGIRGIAILLVLFQHIVADPLEGVVGRLHSLWRIGNVGWTGVDLFFALSGFLIAGILLDNERSPTLLRTFYVRRAFRILPLYLCFVASFEIALRWFPNGVAREALLGGPFPAWTFLTFTQNIAIGLLNTWCSTWMLITWSLAVEEQFYLLLPAMIRIIPRESLVRVFGLVIALACLFRLFPYSLYSLVMLPWRIDCLMTGAALAVLVRQPPFMAGVRRHRQKLVAALPFLAWGSFCFVGSGRSAMRASF